MANVKIAVVKVKLDTKVINFVHIAVGTTDSLLEAAGLDSSDSAKELSAPPTPTSYLSMPSVRSFPR